jgi:hypothetical protein
VKEGHLHKWRDGDLLESVDDEFLSEVRRETKHLCSQVCHRDNKGDVQRVLTGEDKRRGRLLRSRPERNPIRGEPVCREIVEQLLDVVDEQLFEEESCPTKAVHHALWFSRHQSTVDLSIHEEGGAGGRDERSAYSIQSLEFHVLLIGEEIGLEVSWRG